MQPINSDWKALVYCWIVISAAVFFSSCQSDPEALKTNSMAVPSPTIDSQKVMTVDPGDPESAIAYYYETLTELGLNPKRLPAGELVRTMDYPVYFLVFGKRLLGSKLITFLKATFDARAPDIVSDARYYVPNACAECHGGLKNLKPIYENLKLNFLDTDHWFDRVRDDFAFLKNHKCGKNYRCAVLYDGGNTTAEFERAFDVIRDLNREIEAQNKTVSPPQSFQWRAVSKWLELHNTDSKPRDVFARALPPAEPGEPWREDSKTDKELLPLLSRYCYRCHSSLRFSVFDKPVVVRKRNTILDYMTRAIDDEKKMPQDRNLECSKQSFNDKRKILELVKSFPTP